jgi:hypothetical protein
MSNEEKAQAALVNIKTRIKLGDKMREAHEAVSRDLDSEVNSLLNAKLHALRAEYMVALKRHDWSYEFSDDYSAYRAGNAQRFSLKESQPIVDPMFDLWNAAAPADYRVKVSA